MLIIAEKADPHAAAVGWAAAQKGATVHFLSSRDIPGPISLAYGGYGAGEMPGLQVGRHRVVWLRRFGAFSLPDDLDSDDLAFATTECRQQFHSMMMQLEGEATMVNPFSATQASVSKPYQLALAQRAGLTVPPTLVTSDPEAARAFCQDLGGSVIFKAMSLPTFTEAGELLVVPSSRVVAADLRDEVVASCPCMLQAEIPRSYDVRAFFFGDEVIAVRFRPAGVADEVDWRLALHSGDCEVFELPPACEARCRLLMRNMGLVSGSIDLAITMNGDIVFFEINSSGQFLFIEERMPELRVLDRFVGYLCCLDGCIPAPSRLALADFYAAAA